ncbi:MAG: hypothetical protein KKA62_05145 [Nanoarchaeota archaeon]|nr:hypothetical protein [Nanoarchaeota archaeon]MBU1644066.1 hypothetical protein [Nanoarchaeota archaeon]MBU1977308.1 hypothetical protein [Nanoarchaeota archaeon]
MSLKKELFEKVPVSVKEGIYFPALLDHIKNNQIKTKEHLKSFLLQNIQLSENWLKTYKNEGTINLKTVRDKVIELKVLKKCFGLAKEFL